MKNNIYNTIIIVFTKNNIFAAHIRAIQCDKNYQLFWILNGVGFESWQGSFYHHQSYCCFATEKKKQCIISLTPDEREPSHTKSMWSLQWGKTSVWCNGEVNILQFIDWEMVGYCLCRPVILWACQRLAESETDDEFRDVSWATEKDWLLKFLTVHGYIVDCHLLTDFAALTTYKCPYHGLSDYSSCRLPLYLKWRELQSMVRIVENAWTQTLSGGGIVIIWLTSTRHNRHGTNYQWALSVIKCWNEFGTGQCTSARSLL